ncbi:MAG: hypothetical protein IT318_14965 [Anaerolineales bacterium]|nr:hypothetical protein [Anaerolineales bacterium]
MKSLFDGDALARFARLWLLFMAVTWTVFGAGVLTHGQAWLGVPVIERQVGWPVLGTILGHNLLLLALIAGGNLFVRFGTLTPGLVILLVQAVVIGWTAGANRFAEPFASVAAANLAFVRVGLWETTAYVLICAATLPKSLYVASAFPARQWAETRSLRSVAPTLPEALMAGAAVACVLGAAWVEAFPRA